MHPPSLEVAAIPATVGNTSIKCAGVAGESSSPLSSIFLAPLSERVMHISVYDDDTDNGEGPGPAYNDNCNTTMDRRGYLRLCKSALTRKGLESDGWRHTETSGRNSYIFKRKNWVLKVVKHYTTRDFYCPSISETVKRIHLLCENLGPLSPRVRHIRVCSWYREPALTLLMRDEGETHVSLPSVTDLQLRQVVRRLVQSDVMSRDVITDVIRVNTGNLVFRVSPTGRTLSVRFLDVDVPENFMNTTNVPKDLLERIWYKVVRTCLRRPTPVITHAEMDALSSFWTPLFDIDDSD